MMTNATILLALLWTLFLAPSACLSGALDHFCVEDAEEACGHEVGCSTDPCNVAVVLGKSVRGGDSHDELALALVPAVAASPVRPDLDRAAGRPVLFASAQPRLPLPAAALPLLC